MDRKQKLGCRAVLAIAACAVLTVTAAAAAIPAVWETMQDHLGAFAPYAQPVKGAYAADQGVKVQVLSALSDDLETRVYLSVQDMEGDRLDEHLTLEGRLENGERKDPDVEPPRVSVSTVVGSGQFDLISYDPEAKTALFSASVLYGEDKQPSQYARLSLTGMTTRKAKMNNDASLGAIGGEVLNSLPMGAEDRTILSPSDIINLGYTDDILPDEQVVLAPEQNPMPIEGTEDMWISSMGLASDGRFHIRLGFADGVSILDEKDDHWFLCALLPYEIRDTLGEPYRETLVPGGVDILFPLINAGNLEAIHGCTARFYGRYTRPGTDIQGTWDIQFPLEHYPSTVLGWTGEVTGRQVRQVTISPLSVTMYSNNAGGFASATLYAVKKDGSIVAAEPGTGRYSGVGPAGSTVWDAYNTWQFEEPVDVEDVASLTLHGVTIPVS